MPQELPLYTVYLIGDAGKPNLHPLEPALALLHEKLKNSPENSSVIFLGDNLYPKGLRPKEASEREQDEKYLLAQLEITKGFKGKVIFIPGNHDWQQGGRDGWKNLQRQEKFIHKFYEKEGRKDPVFLPEGGCPGIVEVELTPELTLLIVDTQWWLHRHEKPKGEADGCEVLDEASFALNLDNALKSNRLKNTLVVGHHPMFSNGEHGGYFPFKQHIFPLTALKPNLYIPLPLLGSLYPLYRSNLGDIQDIPHPRYRLLQNLMTTSFEKYGNVIYVNGHEHNLQYVQKNGIHYITSGSGCKETYVKHNKQIEFGQKANGFVVIKYFANGEVWMEVIEAGSIRKKGNEVQIVSGSLGIVKSSKEVSFLENVVFRKKLKEAKQQIMDNQNTNTNPIRQKTVLAVADSNYKAGNFKQKFLGKMYRDVWTSPIEVPVLQLDTAFGGLKPVGMGGGMQTKSLRLKAKNGREYTLRTTRKFAEGVIPKSLQKTIAKDIIQDAIAAAHPFSFLAVAPIADAVGVFHTNPQLVFVPDNELLGEYRKDFAATLCLLEERPRGDMSHEKSFGNSKKVINSAKLFEKLHEDEDHRVDKFALIRARLLDMLLGDWDRHEDQWVWASFQEGKKLIYKPIPRDRDQVFFRQDGILPSLSNRKWAMRKFQPFNPDIRDIKGQNFNARYLDRALLTEASLQEWISVADSMQKELTDKHLQEGLARLPKKKIGDSLQIFESNKNLFSVLQQRRNKLSSFARRYYEVLATEVEIIGTLKDDYFEVNRLENGDVEVWLSRKKDNKKKERSTYYHRVFKYNETNEIRLFGLGGEDEYQITGNAKKSILVRVIAGEDKDTFADNSKVKKGGKRTVLYDTQNTKNTDLENVTKGTETRLKISDNTNSIVYNRKSFVYDSYLPLLSLQFNPDDGIYLGGGVIYHKQGFQKTPYRYRLQGSWNMALRTGAFNGILKADFRQVFGRWGLLFDFNIHAPEFRFNFYGLGNETTKPDFERAKDELDAYRFRMDFLESFIALKRTSQSQFHTFSIGSFIQSALPEIKYEDLNVPIQKEQLKASDFQRKTFAGGRLEYSLENKDNTGNPNRGIHFNSIITYGHGLGDVRQAFLQMQSSLSLYFPLNFMPTKTTLAIRGGGGITKGDYLFYQANYLGGLKEMRGIRRNRFGGDKSFYNNIDLRMKLFQWNTYLAPIEVGILGFTDRGRVWWDKETSNKWHKSYGGGIYLSPLNRLTIILNYADSDDDDLITVQAGFMF
ncbi:MAG: metallophosphoesterase [Flammeovirgaceae bacterium]